MFAIDSYNQFNLTSQKSKVFPIPHNHPEVYGKQTQKTWINRPCPTASFYPYVNLLNLISQTFDSGIIPILQSRN